MQAPDSSNVVRFGPFQLDLKAGELHRDAGRSIRLQEQPFKVLKMLLEHPREVVTREEMRRRLWPNDTVVEFDQSINAAIKKLRVALEESAEEPRYVETVARRGYRLLVPVESPVGLREEISGTRAEGPSPAKAAVDGSLIGRKVSHYRVLQVLGGGGMGVVYKAEDLKLGRPVALKFLPEELASDPKALQRFEREARSVSLLQHRNICPIYQFSDHESQPFIVMPLLEGQTLRDRIATRAAPLSIAEVLDLGGQLAEGLEAAHEKGIVHRDIKPGNVFITDRGEAKILDFGLSKLTDAVELDNSETGAKAPPATHLTVTATGVAMGTAAYMSPEQIRGEKLDARTDLFSFGLVLYEMVTGVQAFSADSAPAVQDAILHRTLPSVRELNPEVPVRLDQIIKKAVMKERELRYQSAAEMVRDLRCLQKEKDTRHSYAWQLGLTTVTTSVLIIAAWFWFARHRADLFQPLLLEQRQLTSNSSEKAVLSGSVSPDGRYLAFADMQGIHVKLIETGESALIPAPESLKGVEVRWGVVPTWLRDGAHFIANAEVPGRPRSIWIVPSLGGPPQKLREDATALAVSRDGSWVAFAASPGRLGLDREMWLMRPDGTGVRKLFELDEDSGLLGAESSPDGRRLAYTNFRNAPNQRKLTLESRDVHGGPAVAMIGAEGIRDFSWSPDGRMIYALTEPGPVEDSCNYWAIRIDTTTGRLLENPKRLTSWAGFCMDSTSATADGKRLVYRKHSLEGSVYISNFEDAGARISTPTRLTLNEGRDFASAWTADSKAVVFVSYRDGQWKIFKQFLDNDTAQTIAIGAVGDHVGAFPRVSPDGRWILYVAPPDQGQASPSDENELMRVPIAGGTPELIMPVLSVGGPACSKYPARLCVIAERTADRKHLIFTAFDPLRGRGPELTRLDVDPAPSDYIWDLSPDGTKVAVLGYSQGRIHVLGLHGERFEDIHENGWSGLLSVNWAADGRGLLVSSLIPDGSALLHLDLKGRAAVLWKEKGSTANDPSSAGWIAGPNACWAVPSPDGRHLAINERKLNANMWMTRNY